VSENTTAWASDSGMKHSPDEASALILALTATDGARAQLDRYAVATDAPAWGAVEAADLLDAARAALAGEATP
nr:hypothetical protein [Pseudomonadota bacterium]